MDSKKVHHQPENAAEQQRQVRKPRSNFRAVVMAAGQGSRLPELTNIVPKFLLPIGGVPLVWYPLNLLARSGFKEATVIVREGTKAAIESALANGKAPLTIHFATVPDNEDLGTADSIRYLGIQGHLVVVSGDLVVWPEVSLSQLILTHVSNRAAFTALLSPLPQLLPSQELPGFKQKPSYEKELFGIEENTGQLLYHAPSTQQTINLGDHILNGHAVQFTRTLQDCHAYVIRDYVTAENIHDPMVSSLRTDLLPNLVRKQFRELPPSQEDKERRRLLEMFGPRRQLGPAYPRCFATVLSPTLPSLRVNTLLAYIQANRQASAMFAAEIPPRALQVKIGPSGVTGSGVNRTKKATVQESILGADCCVGDKARVIRSILMPGSIVEEGAKVTDSVLLPGTTIGANSTVTACIVAQQVAPSAKHHHEVLDSSVQVDDSKDQESDEEEEEDDDDLDDDSAAELEL